MPNPNRNSRGEALAQRLQRGQIHAERAPLPSARQLPVLHGLTQGCVFIQPQENVLATARSILVESRRVYTYGNTIVMNADAGDDRYLATLVNGGHVEASAAAVLANLFVCEAQATRDNQPAAQFPPPKGFVDLLLNSEPTWQALPHIQTYATRPIFDRDFRLVGAGWHAESGTLVHGPAVEPQLLQTVDTSAPALRRLPPHLRQLLSGFCFRSDADLVAAAAALLTGMMPMHFVPVGKPVFLLDGNRPGVGKTLLARAIGTVHDGTDPDLIHYTPNDEELAKRICATLRSRRHSMLLIDNAKVQGSGTVSSAVIEANSMAPQITLRILGQSVNYSQPNDVLWTLTMNATKVSPDLVSRGVPVRQYYEGDPAERRFAQQDPIAYAIQHRTEILGELAGAVVRWNQLGRPRGTRYHRCAYWAEIIGGILVANGLPEFLGNIDEAAEDFDLGREALASVAETAIQMGRGHESVTE